MKLVQIAEETVAISERGSYVAPDGRNVDLSESIRDAIAKTTLYRPADLEALPLPPAPETSSVRLEVTDETTSAAAGRLVRDEGLEGVALLNFASARNAGGGFLRGAKAQEEDLARASALYVCLRSQPTYYDVNRSQESMIYTDHIIYSHKVPFFRDDRLTLLEEPFVASVITAPAPNAGEELRRYPPSGPAIVAALERRAGFVLAVAHKEGHRNLVLGAWGCGVFRNDPSQVADVFGRLLEGPYRGAFDRVVFGVYDRSTERSTLRAFQARFSGTSGT